MNIEFIFDAILTPDGQFSYSGILVIRLLLNFQRYERREEDNFLKSSQSQFVWIVLFENINMLFTQGRHNSAQIIF